MKKLMFVLSIFSLPAQADVYKCKISEFKTAYQTTPCAGAADAQKIDIKRRSAKEDAEAEARRQAWEAKYAEEQAAKKAALKAEEQDLLHRAEIAAAQRNANAQYDQADAQNRQATALENSNVIKSIILPYR